MRFAKNSPFNFTNKVSRLKSGQNIGQYLGQKFAKILATCQTPIARKSFPFCWRKNWGKNVDEIDPCFFQ